MHPGKRSLLICCLALVLLAAPLHAGPARAVEEEADRRKSAA